MVGLLDIAPVSKTVSVNGNDVPVFGVSAKGIASLMQVFPLISEMLASQKLDVQYLLERAPDLCAAIIAAGTGTPGNKKASDLAANLPVEAQLDLLEAIFERTAPNGIGPFVRRLTGLINTMLPSASANNSSAAPSATSTGKGPDTSSPPPSSDSLPMDMPPETSGT